MATRVNVRHRALHTRGALLAVSVGGALACAQSAVAQDPGQVTIDARRCIELTSPQDRLACYEAQVGKALGTDKGAQTGASAPAPSEEVPQPVEAKAAEARAAEAKAADPTPTTAVTRSTQPATDTPPAAGRARTDRAEEPQARTSRAERRAKAREDREAQQTEFVATIAALREREPNQLVITLENGQVWAQTAPEQYHLRVGHEVRIRSSRWGGMYRLTDDDLRGFILVRRVE